MNTQKSWYTNGTGVSVRISASAGVAYVPPRGVKISMTPDGQFTVTYFPPPNVGLAELVLSGEIEELTPYNNRYNKVLRVKIMYGGTTFHLDVSQKKFLMPVQNS